MGILEIITLKGLLAGWACILILIIPFAIYKKERRLEQERIQKLEEQFLKRLHHKHKLKKPGEINEL